MEGEHKADMKYLAEADAILKTNIVGQMSAGAPPLAGAGAAEEALPAEVIGAAAAGKARGRGRPKGLAKVGAQGTGRAAGKKRARSTTGEDDMEDSAPAEVVAEQL